jgi:hypothetical protein
MTLPRALSENDSGVKSTISSTAEPFGMTKSLESRIPLLLMFSDRAERNGPDMAALASLIVTGWDTRKRVLSRRWGTGDKGESM